MVRKLKKITNNVVIMIVFYMFVFTDSWQYSTKVSPAKKITLRGGALRFNLDRKFNDFFLISDEDCRWPRKLLSEAEFYKLFSDCWKLRRDVTYLLASLARYIYCELAVNRQPGYRQRTRIASTARGRNWWYCVCCMSCWTPKMRLEIKNPYKI